MRLTLIALFAVAAMACNKEHQDAAANFSGERNIYYLVEEGDTLFGENGVDAIGKITMGGGGYGTLFFQGDTLDLTYYTVSANTVIVPQPLNYVNPTSGRVFNFSGYWTKEGRFISTEQGFKFILD